MKSRKTPNNIELSYRNKKRLPKPYILTLTEYDALLKFFVDCANSHFSNWPPQRKWPKVGDIDFTIAQIKFKGRNALIIHFASGIQLPDKRIGRVFHLYGNDAKSRNFQLRKTCPFPDIPTNLILYH